MAPQSRSGFPDRVAPPTRRPHGPQEHQRAAPAAPTQMPSVPQARWPSRSRACRRTRRGGLRTPAVAPRSPGTEAADRIAIDARQLQVRRDGNDWKLAMGNHVIANFGPNQADAQLAQAALRYYRVHGAGFRRQPAAGVLVLPVQRPGAARHQLRLQCRHFRPESLSVRQLGPVLRAV